MTSGWTAGDGRTAPQARRYHPHGPTPLRADDDQRRGESGPTDEVDGHFRDRFALWTHIRAEADDRGGGLSSKGTPEGWAQAVLDAKQGVAESVVVLNIGWNEPVCNKQDGLCQMAKMFPNHHLVYSGIDDYGPAFDEAASLVETACAGFVVPG